MSLYFVFTVDGDWEEYFYSSFPEEKRKPKKAQMLSWVDHEIQISSKLLGGKFLHFIHTSPRARDYFLKIEFILRWSRIEKGGGDVGIHCHEDDPDSAYYYDDEKRMKKAIGFMAERLRKNGLRPWAYRGGYLAFSPKIIKVLEKNHIFLDFSCDPGRYLFHGDILVSDWRGAPDNFYRMSYKDHRKKGKSRIIEVPMGIYLDEMSLRQIRKTAKALKAKPETQIVSVLTHSYEFSSFFKRLKIKLALGILKRYGRFVNVRDVLELAAKK